MGGDGGWRLLGGFGKEMCCERRAEGWVNGGRSFGWD